LFTNDALTARADSYLRAEKPMLIVSDFAAVEFASAIARRVRMEELSSTDARIAFSNFDAWIARTAQRAQTGHMDVTAAAAFLRRLDLTLRTPDALNIAIAQRTGAILATFDVKMAASARALGNPVALA
jgi:predicted nucleic acid-binding protein